MSAALVHHPDPWDRRPLLTPVADAPESDAEVRLAEAEAVIASQQKALRETETLLTVVENAVAELAAAHSPIVRRLCHAAERTRRLLAPTSP